MHPATIQADEFAADGLCISCTGRRWLFSFRAVFAARLWDVVLHRASLLVLTSLVLLMGWTSTAHAKVLFFVQGNGQGIRTSALDGTNESNVSAAVGNFSGGVAFDEPSDKVYFTRNTSSTHRVLRVNPDGTDLVIAATDNTANLQAVDVNTSIDKLAWVRTGGVNSNLFVRNVSGGGGLFLVSESSSFTTFHDIEIDPANQKIYWVQQELQVLGTSKIRRINLDGTGAMDVITGLTRPVGLALDIAGGLIYWTDENAVRRANLNGSSVTDIFVDASLNFFQDIDIDLDGGKAYFSEEVSSGSGPIHRVNLNGSQHETLPISARRYLAIGRIPEPSSILLLAMGIAALVTRCRHCHSLLRDQ